MHQYELMVIIDPSIDERTVETSLEKFLAVITNSGGTIDNVDVWGRRRLAYEIQKHSEGVYAVVDFTSSSDAAKELDRQLRLSEAVIRTKVLRAEEAIARAKAESHRRPRSAEAQRPESSPRAEGRPEGAGRSRSASSRPASRPQSGAQRVASATRSSASSE